MKWALAHRRLRFLGLVSEWVIEREIPLDAWRCKACGYCELATAPDPIAARRPVREDAKGPDDSTLL